MMSLEKPTVDDFGAFSYDEPIFGSWEPNEEDLKVMEEQPKPEIPVHEPNTPTHENRPIYNQELEEKNYRDESVEKKKQNILEKIGSFVTNMLYIVIQVASDLVHVAVFNTLLGNNERINITKSINAALIKAQGHTKGEEHVKTEEHEKLQSVKQKEENRREEVEQKETVAGGLRINYQENTEHVTLTDEHGNRLSVPKEDVFAGDVETVAKKLHEMCDKKNKIECLTQASLAIAKVRYEEGEKGKLAAFDFRTDRGWIQTELKMNSKSELAVICNGKHVLTEEISKLNPQKMKECIFSFKERYVKFLMVEITVSVGREFTDIYVTAGDKIQHIGSYKFETEQDVMEMAERLKESETVSQALNEMHITPEAISYVTGIITNPEMEFQRNEDGNVLNPFTGKTEHDGNAHLFYHQDSGKLMMYEPNEYEKGVHTEIFKVPSVLEITSEQFNGMIEAVQTCQLCMESNVFEVADYNRENEQIIETCQEQDLKANQFFEESLQKECEEPPQLSDEQIYELFEEECR